MIHPKRCETCNRRKTLTCPIQDETAYYKIKEVVSVPYGWELLTSIVGCASHISEQSTPEPTPEICRGCTHKSPPEQCWYLEHNVCPHPQRREQGAPELLYLPLSKDTWDLLSQFDGEKTPEEIIVTALKCMRYNSQEHDARIRKEERERVLKIIEDGKSGLKEYYPDGYWDKTSQAKLEVLCWLEETLREEQR